MIRMEGGCVGDLANVTPCGGFAPIKIGGLRLSEVSPAHVTALLPYRGQEAALDAALRAAHGLGFPALGGVSQNGTGRCLWAGDRQAMLVGLSPDAALAECASIVDQSDGWAMLRLEGEGARDVLARLVPVDLRLPAGHCLRSLVGHMAAVITVLGETGYEIWVFRSMAETAVHEIEQAMRQYEARRRA
jgi:heterotetrameric sarcosine oxidase gamma subunit